MGIYSFILLLYLYSKTKTLHYHFKNKISFFLSTKNNSFVFQAFSNLHNIFFPVRHQISKELFLEVGKPLLYDIVLLLL